MSDLIDKKGLIEYLDGEDLTYIEDFYNAIRRAPAVDAVEVVRCLDCKWFNNPGCAISIADDSDRPTENDFCGFGERREEDEVD